MYCSGAGYFRYERHSHNHFICNTIYIVPDVILLDLVLPGIQGKDVCKVLRADAKLKNMPIILFTASACDLEKTAKEIGADDFIGKPFKPEELLAKIKKHIG